MRYLSEQSEPRWTAEPGRPARWPAGRDRAEARPANAEAGPGWPARRPEAGSAKPAGSANSEVGFTDKR
jgi:hypothetical protein